jgi:hypothetical protein
VKDSGFIDAVKFTGELENEFYRAWIVWCNSRQELTRPDELLKEGEGYFQSKDK